MFLPFVPLHILIKQCYWIYFFFRQNLYECTIFLIGLFFCSYLHFLIYSYYFNVEVYIILLIKHMLSSGRISLFLQLHHHHYHYDRQFPWPSVIVGSLRKLSTWQLPSTYLSWKAVRYSFMRQNHSWRPPTWCLTLVIDTWPLIQLGLISALSLTALW